jgi:hypothetical protein
MAQMPLPGGDAMQAPVMAAEVQGSDGAGVAGPASIAGGAGVPIGVKRDPFWPVGYVPKVAAPDEPVAKGGGVAKPSDLATAPVAEPDWVGARRKLDVRGVSLIGRDKETGKPRYFAVVAGKLVEPGNVVAVTHEDRVYRWKVVDIRPEGVSLSKLEVKP